MDDSLHWIELIPSILVLELILDHMEDVATCYVSCCILLAYDSILAAAKVIALQEAPQAQRLLVFTEASCGISRVFDWHGMTDVHLRETDYNIASCCTVPSITNHGSAQTGATHPEGVYTQCQQALRECLLTLRHLNNSMHCTCNGQCQDCYRIQV